MVSPALTVMLTNHSLSGAAAESKGGVERMGGRSESFDRLRKLLIFMLLRGCILFVIARQEAMAEVLAAEEILDEG